MVESAAKASASAYLNSHNEKFATDSQISKYKETQKIAKWSVPTHF
jgi:hypothetical protein